MTTKNTVLNLICTYITNGKTITSTTTTTTTINDNKRYQLILLVKSFIIDPSTHCTNGKLQSGSFENHEIILTSYDDISQFQQYNNSIEKFQTDICYMSKGYNGDVNPIIELDTNNNPQKTNIVKDIDTHFKINKIQYLFTTKLSNTLLGLGKNRSFRAYDIILKDTTTNTNVSYYHSYGKLQSMGGPKITTNLIKYIYKATIPDFSNKNLRPPPHITIEVFSPFSPMENIIQFCNSQHTILDNNIDYNYSINKWIQTKYDNYIKHIGRGLIDSKIPILLLGHHAGILVASIGIRKIKDMIEQKFFQYRDIDKETMYNCGYYIPHISIGITDKDIKTLPVNFGLKDLTINVFNNISSNFHLFQTYIQTNKLTITDWEINYYGSGNKLN